MRSRFAGVIVAIVLATGLAANCYGWGAQGHRIIGQIAWHYLSPEAKAGLTELLGDQSLGEAGTWADEVRGDKAYDWARPLHYVNVPRDAEAVDTARDCPNGECVVGAIRRFRAVVEDKQAPREQRIEALKFLIHFVGDVHQPLHVSYADDRGGNKRALTFMGKKTNFHALWDTGLIEQKLAGGDWMKWGDELQGTITAETAKNYASSTDPLAWANETLQITRRLYSELDNDDLGAAYYERNMPVVEDQLERAGIRLATILNAIFAQPTTQPATAPATKPADVGAQARIDSGARDVRWKQRLPAS